MMFHRVIPAAGSRCLGAGHRAIGSTGHLLARKSSPLFQSHVYTPIRVLSSKSSAKNRSNHRMVSLLSAAAVSLGGLLYIQSQNPALISSGYGATVQSGFSNPPLSLVPTQAGETMPPSTEIFEEIDESLEISDLPKEEAVLTTAPNVPPPITRDYPVLLQVPLTTVTKVAQLTSQFKYEQWTFNNTVPGPFIRARVGDVVEVKFTNRDVAGNPHNIDCHAFTGPGGGASLTTTEENETKMARFKLLSPGLYLYHCAAAPVPVHIANGMYGLIYVQPEVDLPPVDKEYYVMQSEFYHEPPETDDDGRRSDTVEFSYPNGLREEPNVVVFNGSESALTRDHPLKARVGESIRIFFGNAGPNLSSSFHVIGSLFRNVYRDGDVVSPPGQYIQTVGVPPGGATVVDMKLAVPGTYTLVDHAIFRLDKGAVGFLNVSGKQRPDIYQSALPPAPCAGCKLHS
ncbi:nitrite reductase-I [Thelonectria olida]|uniref:Copper-containing nitrite reductase n=1 Tax=Thelonectria olida TaxID=1576542 RepID=A0A9P8VW76_9HYPO|nr:nitrite reductase-I [Thelonectria olida]